MIRVFLEIDGELEELDVCPSDSICQGGKPAHCIRYNGHSGGCDYWCDCDEAGAMEILERDLDN